MGIINTTSNQLENFHLYEKEKAFSVAFSVCYHHGSTLLIYL